MKSIKDQDNLNQKKILLRLDLNVPLRNGLIADETRINKIIPVINYLLEKKSKIIIISHIGRPNGKKKILDPSVNSNTINIKPRIPHKVGLKIYSIIKSFFLPKSGENCFQTA